MSAPDGLVAVVPAAGFSTRFGGDKLLAPFRGRPLAAHIADTLANWNIKHRIAICPRGNAARADLFGARGFEIVWNDEPQRGLGHSLALGAARAQDLKAASLLVCLADMPAVSIAHLERLVAAQTKTDAVATCVNGVRMPPVLFPSATFHRIVSLTGDKGAKALLLDAVTVDADATLARDLDTPRDFDAANGVTQGPAEPSRE